MSLPKRARVAIINEIMNDPTKMPTIQIQLAFEVARLHLVVVGWQHAVGSLDFIVRIMIIRKFRMQQCCSVCVCGVLM